MTRMAESAFGQAAEPESIEIVWYIDEDDPVSRGTAEELADRWPGRTDMVVGGRIVLSAMWNAAYERCQGDILGHLGDDIVFRSANWDGLIRAEFNKVKDKILFVHGRDGYHDARFGTHGFIHRNWVDVVGYFVPPFFSSDHNDEWLNDVANGIGRRVFLNDVYTEHMHYVFGKSGHDKTYQEREARGRRDNVTAMYNSPEHRALRQADMAKLRVFMEEHV